MAVALVTKFVLDTNAYSVFFRGENPALRPYFTARNHIVVPTVVVGELRAGFAAGNKQTFNDRNLKKFLSSPNVDVVTLSDQTTSHYARVFASLKRVGTPIGTNDMWIAAIAIEFDIPLLTLDTDFRRIPGLRLIKA